VGYIWKLEFGRRKGYHYHCLFFLDGKYHRKDKYLCDQIGEVWSEVLGVPDAYFNCNRTKRMQQYKYLGIGFTESSDDVFFDNLLKIIRYITKRDQFIVDSCIPPKARVFGKGILPRVARHMGRKRKQYLFIR
jgi:hypothetical protein